MAVWIIVAIVAVAAIWLVLTYNRLVRLRNECDQGFSSIDVMLKRRADLIPNLVEAVKAYATHEREAFERVSQARAAALGATSLDEKAAADGQMQTAVRSLLAVAEAYPQLRAVESFTALQSELSDTEDKIAAARRYYNTVVRKFNTVIQSVPSNVVARVGSFAGRQFYRIEDDADRQPVAVAT